MLGSTIYASWILEYSDEFYFQNIFALGKSYFKEQIRTGQDHQDQKTSLELVL